MLANPVMDQDVPLDPETFDMAATRPPMTLGLPHTLSVSLLAAGLLFLMLYGTGDLVWDTIGDAVFIGALAMVWSAARIVLRADYHGFDILVAWLRLDARFLDTAESGGARLTAFPLRSVYSCSMHDDA